MPRPAPAKRRASMAPFYALLGLVLVAGIGLIATQLGGKEEEAATSAPVAVALTPEQIQQTQGISVGRSDAPIQIFQFADFQCPHCGTFSSFVEPLIKQNLVETGKARYVFYDFPLGGGFQHGFLASRGGRCANEQQKFWPYHDRVFANQREWSYAQADDAPELFVKYAGDAGLDARAFETCLRSDKYAAEVSQSRKFGESLGVTGTPAIFVNGRRIETPNSYREFEAAVRQIAPGAFAEAAAAEAPGAAPAAPAAGGAPAAPAGTR